MSADKQKLGQEIEDFIRKRRSERKMGVFMGNRITSKNRNDYRKKQEEFFTNQYLKDLEAKKKEIENDENLSEDQKADKVYKLMRESLNDRELENSAERFGRYMVNKENKHFQAFLKGKSSYKYKGETFPVLTEEFLKKNKSIKDIIKVEEDDQ